MFAWRGVGTKTVVTAVKGSPAGPVVRSVDHGMCVSFARYASTAELTRNLVRLSSDSRVGQLQETLDGRLDLARCDDSAWSERSEVGRRVKAIISWDRKARGSGDLSSVDGNGGSQPKKRRSGKDCGEHFCGNVYKKGQLGWRETRR